MNDIREVRLFRNGRNQAVRIPVEFELPGDTATMHREGGRLVIEPVRRPDLFAILATLDDLDVPEFDFDEGMLPLDDISFE